MGEVERRRKEEITLCRRVTSIFNGITSATFFLFTQLSRKWVDNIFRVDMYVSIYLNEPTKIYKGTYNIFVPFLKQFILIKRLMDFFEMHLDKDFL